MNRQELLDTIQRLLALSSSSNEHESQLALARANALMAQHNISMLEVESADNQNESWITADIYESGKASTIEPFICSILSDYFFVQPIRQRDQRTRRTLLRFFGDSTNVEIARYTYFYLMQVFKRLANERNIRHSDRQTYYAGLSSGFREKLKSEREFLHRIGDSQNALVLVGDKMKNALTKHHPNLRFGKPIQLGGSLDAYNKGKQDGKSIDLKKGLGSNSVNQRRLSC